MALAARLLLPAAAVFALCLSTGGWFVVVLVAALVAGLGLTLLGGTLQQAGLGLLLGCGAVLLAVAVQYE